MQKKEKKYALCVGLNKVDTHGHYHGEEKRLSRAINSMNFFQDHFTKDLGFLQQNVFCYEDEDAKVDDFIGKLKELANELDHGDTLAIYFCGHGYQLSPRRQQKYKLRDEEGWCFYDRILFFVELWELARRFRAGVKIVIIADSCYAGGGGTAGSEKSERRLDFFDKNIKGYLPILSFVSRPMEFQVPATFLFIASTSDDGEAQECAGEKFDLSVFAYVYKEVYSKEDMSQLNFEEFYEKIQRKLFLPTNCNQSEPQHPRWYY